MKKIKILNLIILAIICFYTAMVGCKKNEDEIPTTPVAINKTETAVIIGGSETLSITGYEGEVVWASSDESIVSVNNGVITGLVEGVSYITATAGENNFTCKVWVAEKSTLIPLLKFESQSLAIAKGLSLKVNPYVQKELTFTKIEENVVWSSSDNNVAIIENGEIKGVEVGSCVITAKYTHEGKSLSAEFKLTVATENYYKAYIQGKEDSLEKPINVVAKNEFLGTTTPSTERVLIKEVDINSSTEKLIKSGVSWTSTDSAVATASDDVITGGNKNGTCELTAKIGENVVAKIKVVSWAEITTIEQMNKLALVTWLYKDNAEKVKEVLGSRYVLGCDIDYNGEYILPIANTKPDIETMGFSSQIFSFDSWVWADILSKAENKSLDDWKSGLKFNTMESTFEGSNPLNLPFTGEFDGNGYTISNAQLVDVNHLYANRGDAEINCYYAGGGCFIGTNEGIVKNINFEGLRYRKFYGNVEDRYKKLDENSSTPTKIFLKLNGTLVPYANTIRVTNNYGLVRENKGTLTDIRISAHHMGSYSVYDTRISGSTTYQKAQATTNGGFFVAINKETGIVNNAVFVLERGDIPQFKVEGAKNNIKSGLSNHKIRPFFAYNYGVVSNCNFFSMVQDGYSVVVDHVTGSYFYNLKRNVCDYTEYYMVLSSGEMSNFGYYWSDWENYNCYYFYTGLADSFNANLWDTLEFTMTPGIWKLR